MQKVFTTFVLSKTAFGQLFRFFIIRGDPSDLGGVKISLSRFIVVLQSKLKMFCDQGVKYYTKTASGTQKITKVHFCLYLQCHPTETSQFVWHSFIIWSAQHFETDLNLYNTDMVDYTIVNDSTVGFIAVVYIIKYSMN